MIACFDLARRLPTYDFSSWLVHVKMLGATQITIDRSGKFYMRKKWPEAETLKRLNHYIIPTIALARLPWKFSDKGDHEIGSHLYQLIEKDRLRLGCEIPRLESVLPLGEHRFTVTIRHAWYKPERNSDGEVWREFARRIGAYVFEEHDERPIGLHERVAIYAGAKMNFGVPNGPLLLLQWTRAPLREFCDPALSKDYRMQGIPVGGQVPWFLPNQRLVWEVPTMDNLMREFDHVACELHRDRAL